MARAALAFLLLTSCAQISITREDTPAPSAPHVRRIHSFLWTFVPGPRLPSQSELCPGGRIEALHFGMSGLDVLIASATAGIYVPRRVAVHCSAQN